jgi:hypothetical protein
LRQPGDVPGISREADADVNALGATGVAATASLDNEDPGPKSTFTSMFNLVNALLPDEQNVIAARPDTPVRDALDLMRENGFSQLPAMERDSVIGVFSYRSFANRIVSLGRVDLGRLEVDDCVEDLEFVRVTDGLLAPHRPGASLCRRELAEGHGRQVGPAQLLLAADQPGSMPLTSACQMVSLTNPSCVTPSPFWNPFTAASVLGPKIPSIARFCLRNTNSSCTPRTA